MERAERDARVGSVVDGRYRILDSMASGSMGAVYRAERVPVGKVVAIKFLHSAFASDPEFIGRFERETRVMSKLAHPHCVSVVDFGVTGGEPYLVMDFVSGITLRDVLDDGPLDPIRALSVTRQILAGLAHAHEQGIVHRDIKPANLMITEEIGTGEHVRILDFGLARLRNASVDATQSHIVVGTPSYMAPEQTVGAGVDARADLYAVGCVLFEMITGRRPFTAEETLELLAQHRGAAIPRLADHVKPGTVVPEGLQSVVDRALAKDPDLRFQSAIEFAAAVDGLGVTPGRLPTATVPPIAPAKRRISFSTMILLAAAVVVAAGVWFLTHESDKPGKSKRPTANPVRKVDAGTLASSNHFGPDAAPMRTGGPDAGVAVAAATDAAPAAAVPPDASWLIVPMDAAPSEVPLLPGMIPDAGPDEAEPDPDVADDPDPEAATVAAGSEHDEEEAADAPEDVPEEEPKPPPKAQLAGSVAAAVRLIKTGHRELALSSLRILWKKNKRSSYIPFLLGNLYFDKRWWSVALKHYRIAIQKNWKYRRNGTLNRNVIRMLSSTKTSGKAKWFIRHSIGRSAKPYLKWSAKHDRNMKVRKACAMLNKAIR
jgi:serine/threonine-protein kinase